MLELGCENATVGKNGLTKDSLEKKFKTTESLASVAVTSQKLKFERQLEIFRSFKKGSISADINYSVDGVGDIL